MRLLVISDSHRKGAIVDRIIRQEKDAKHVFFLGDNTDDIEDLVYCYPDRTFHIVSGNCDFLPVYPRFDIAKVENVNIFYTHGHSYGVKYGLDALTEAAAKNDCKIALFGHTHIPYIGYKDGIHIVNCGSCSQSRQGGNTYAVIDILKSGILPQIIYLQS